jgi:hypothetical protein
MAHFPNTFAEELMPLPEDLGEVGNAALERIRAVNFDVKAGLTIDAASQMVAYSKDEAVREYCPNDAQSRFSSLASTQSWLKKHGGRGVLLMTKQVSASTELVAEAGWEGLTSDDPEGEVTFAVRAYELARGKRLTEDFSRVVIAASAVLYGVDSKRQLALETWRSNIAAGKIYGRIGFEETHDVLDKRETLKPTAQQPDGAHVWKEKDGKLYRRDERVHMRFVGES